ncbi:hypothetical protein P3102_33880 [Amycolatopsis sp. QT-25]|nr:hypothetical protein [Amycolatopsis sp. QT-25]WET78975.1 hypothetical protein P3102_33880 [Amycolatopsis sp. QT-25]
MIDKANCARHFLARFPLVLTVAEVWIAEPAGVARTQDLASG